MHSGTSIKDSSYCLAFQLFCQQCVQDVSNGSIALQTPSSLACLQVSKTRGVPTGGGKPHPAPKRKTGLLGRLSRLSGNLNPFEEEEANPRHQHNLHMTVGKVGE